MFFTIGLLSIISCAPLKTPEIKTHHPSPIMARITIATIIHVIKPMTKSRLLWILIL